MTPGNLNSDAPPPNAAQPRDTVGDWSSLGTQPTAIAVASTGDPVNFQDLAAARNKVQLARERFQIARDAESKRRDEMLIDLKFRCGQQWEEWIELRRKQQKRPCLTINRIPGFLKLVLNNLRQARPEVKVDPVGDGADEEIAEIRQGLIRHILVNSRAEIAFDTAFENMATMGLGFLRVVDGWADPMSFDQELYVEWVPNTFSVYFDPGARKPDWSDAKYVFIIEDLSLAEFRQKFGADQRAASLNEFQSLGDQQAHWLPGGKVRVAEYWHIEEEEDTLCEMADGSTVLFSKLPEPAEGAPPPQVIRTRKVRVPYVMWSLISGLDVLKERRWPGRYIPIIPVIGNQIELEGERILVGMVRYAREAQRMYNYMYTSFVEAVALAPKAPFIAEFSQIEEFREIWQHANDEPVAVLPYRAKSADNGTPLPPPQRQQAQTPIGDFVSGLQIADQNLKATFSIYEAALGQKGPQESGVAIQSRKIESDTATYDWIDNFNRSIRYLGLVLNDLLEHYYNTPGRVVQILQEDESQRLVTLNQEHADPQTQEPKKYDLAQGKFAVTISSGPSFSTRRREAANSMMELAKFYPPLMQVAGPLIVKQFDWPGKDAIAKQLEKAMPPELRTQDTSEQQLPPEFQAQMAQAQGLIQKLTEALNAANDRNQLERTKQDYETFRAQLKVESDQAIAALKVQSAEGVQWRSELFNEIRSLRAALEPKVLAGSQPNSPQGGPPNAGGPAAPSSPASPVSVPDAAGNTPAEVGIGTA